jgi:hypothetical protein
MNFADVKLDDPRWSPREKVVFTHLFRTRQRYINEHRPLEAHGCAKAIFVMANVLEALEAHIPDYKPTNFQDLL